MKLKFLMRYIDHVTHEYKQKHGKDLIHIVQMDENCRFYEQLSITTCHNTIDEGHGWRLYTLKKLD